jgi:drug/metabolite transporter (DMT)-like permease
LKDTAKAHIALMGANLLFGLNYVIAKGIMPDFMSPKAIILLRVLVTMIVFNIIHLLFIKEKVKRKDLWRFAILGLFGVFINQFLFFEGLNLSTPINSSLIVTTGPIMAFIFSYIILKERISSSKLIGIILGTSGASMLILLAGKLSLSSDTLLGNLLVFINISSYSLYLVLLKSFKFKYRPLTIIKWVFNFGFVFMIPFCFDSLIQTNFELIPANIWLSISFVVIGATIFAYLLNIFALKTLSPMVTSSYMYTQPAIAGITSIIFLHEELTIIKVIAAILIFSGVYFVSIKKSKSIS